MNTKFLLLCLHVIILLMSMNVKGMPSLSDSSLSLTSPMRIKASANSNERAYRLYNQCAKREILIQDNNRVTATATNFDDKGDLVLETTMTKDKDLRIRIRGLISGRYLCYNRRGRLVAKPKKKARGKKCEFLEVPGDHSSWSYMSAFNNDWFMGFDDKGRPLQRSDHLTMARPKCFRFDKNAHVVTPGVAQNQFNVNKHNRKIGQNHPHLRPDYFSNRGKQRTSTTTTTTEPTTLITTPTTSLTTTTTPTTTTTAFTTTTEVIITSTTTPIPTTTATEPPPPSPTTTTPPSDETPIMVQGLDVQKLEVDDQLFNPETHHLLRHHHNQGKSHHSHPRQRHLKKSQRNRKIKSTTWISSSLV
ncbi:fibroblast growth factor 18 isoform X2 [Folsomia candida]|uniref:Fibroblast growth factor 17 n=1 Tax=Folsomia candida TaxID=158441 RepID=A0A226E8B5_FOLCA|nr:fibroblast growth factor 18 isoform X2 [Folsomia candida]OXA53101.1 Fibroblast growth factor 17 [Folsomia candida]